MRVFGGGSGRRAGGRVAALVCLLLAGAARAQEPSGSGSAFVVQADGILVTAAHVIKNAAKVTVNIDGRTSEARVLVSNEKLDLAILKVPLGNLTPLPLGNSNQVSVGEEVRVFGFPFGTALGESVKVNRGTISGIDTMGTQKVLQTDAPINPGNSGGPLVSQKGEVIAVVSSKLTGMAVSNVGIAVPINYAKQMLREQSVTWQTANLPSAPEAVELIKRVTPSVALVLVVQTKRPGSGPAVAPPVRVAPELPAGAEWKEAPAGWPAYLRSYQPVPGLRYRLATKDGMPQVRLPGGTVRLGTTVAAADRAFEVWRKIQPRITREVFARETPGKTVRLTPFWMDLHPVTVEQYRRYCQATGQTMPDQSQRAVGRITKDGRQDYAFQPPPSLSRDPDRHPVAMLTWAEAQAYATWAGRSLPSEAQWEYAARAGHDDWEYAWGDRFAPPAGFGNLADKSNGGPFSLLQYDDGYPQRSPVQAFAPNAFGLLDIVGNVEVWCRDNFDAGWYEKMPERDPVNVAVADGHARRGASFMAFPWMYRVSFRTFGPDGSAYSQCGFRCVASD